MSSPESSPAHRPESMSPEVVMGACWEGREECAGTGNKGGALVTLRLRRVFRVITTKQTNWRLEFDLFVDPAWWESDSAKTRYVSATEVQARDLGTLELPSPISDSVQPMSGLWSLLSSGQMTAGEGKAFTTVFDLQAPGGTPDLLSSALTYHILTCRLKKLRR